MNKSMLSKVIFLVVALTVFSAAAAMADTAAIIMSGEQEYKAVRLTPEIYNRANRDLSDILVLDGEGTPVPYFMNSYEMAWDTRTGSPYHLVSMDSFVKDGDTYYDFSAETIPWMDIQATSIHIGVNSNMFAKDVEVLGSYDGLVWDYIQTDNLYWVEEAFKLDIKFEKPLKYTHYRLRTINNTSELVISSAELIYSTYDAEQAFFTATAVPAFEIEERDNSTIIKLHGLMNVRINEMTLETDDQFKRQVYFGERKSKTLYNLTVGSDNYQDLTLNFGGYTEHSDVLEIRIANGDDVPIKINNIKLTYFADEVVFKGQGSEYTLSFGDRDARAPVYDIANYKDLIINEGYDLLSLGDIKIESALQDASEPRDYSFAFNAAVVSVSILLGVIILARLRRSGQS